VTIVIDEFENKKIQTGLSVPKVIDEVHVQESPIEEGSVEEAAEKNIVVKENTVEGSSQNKIISTKDKNSINNEAALNSDKVDVRNSDISGPKEFIFTADKNIIKKNNEPEKVNTEKINTEKNRHNISQKSDHFKKIKKHEAIQTRRYVHVVVKGDTLWHIAKRYIDNPWRYPELAKLSKIKNPDLIYPGNKIIIIINTRVSAE